MPANLHFAQPNPEIPFEALKLRVPRTTEPWPETDSGPALAGVNSFGFGGSNAHVLLQEAPTTKPTGCNPWASGISSGRNP